MKGGRSTNNGVKSSSEAHCLECERRCSWLYNALHWGGYVPAPAYLSAASRMASSSAFASSCSACCCRCPAATRCLGADTSPLVRSTPISSSTWGRGRE